MQKFFVYIGMSVWILFGTSVYADTIDQVTLSRGSTQDVPTLDQILLENIEDIRTLFTRNVSGERKNILLGEKYTIDLTDFDTAFFSSFGIHPMYEWHVVGSEEIKKTTVLDILFDRPGEKLIQLSVYFSDTNINQKILLFTETFHGFLYTHSIPFISLEEDQNQYKIFQDARSLGILLDPVFSASEGISLDAFSLSEAYRSYQNAAYRHTTDYLLLIGNRNDIFSLLAKMTQELYQTQSTSSLNILVVSKDNIYAYPQLFANFLAGKTWFSYFGMTNELSSMAILQYRHIQEVAKKLQEGFYEYQEITENTYQIPRYKIFSRFVNQLSNAGFSTANIYYLFLIPFLLTLVVIFKHFIGIGGIGVLMPVFLALMVIKLGFFPLFFIFLGLMVLNILLANFLSGYYMLYIPKIAFFITINIVVFFLILQIGMEFSWFTLAPHDILYYIVFIFLLERIVSMIWSKEFDDYSRHTLNTFIFVGIAYLLFSANFIQNIILTYPETVIVLVFANLFFSRYTGLRLTEYFRFQEVLQSVEEE